MKFLIAMMKHETNTFSPVPTPLSRFGSNGGPLWGDAAFDAYKGTRTPMAAYIDLAEAEGVQIITPVAAEALPSGVVPEDVYNSICDAICNTVKEGCDAVFLDLHGAMVTETTDDGEGALLERIRSISPDLPIAVALDLHANLTDRIVRNCTAVVGYKTYPHIDMYEAGCHAGTIVIRALKGEIRPKMVWGNCPLLAHTLLMNTGESPMKDLIDAALASEKSGCLAATVFGGFNMADIPEAGVSAVVVSDGEEETARLICNRLLALAWEKREEFIYHSEPLADSIARAKGFADGPVLLIDHADNCASGATQDTMTVVAEIIRQGLNDVAVGAICDPAAVEQMIAAGVGSKVTVSLGGKIDMPALGRKGEPLMVTGVVRVITDGTFTPHDPTYAGVWTFLGRTAVLDTGTIQFIVISRNHEPWDMGLFRSVGIEPAKKKYLMLKSRIYYRAGFLPIARHIVECAGVGVSSSDYSLFTYEKVRRPIYPFDNISHAYAQ
ncbi:MAG: M81 family metallopeptidase [Desulfuromonadales bacterium]